MYQVVELPDDASDLPEQIGTKRKFWFRDPEGRWWLFKEGRPNTGENWAEKICSELCRLIGIPHAKYEFGVWRGRKGVITPRFVAEDARLVLGNELLAKLVEDYPHTERYKARQHTLTLVLSIMRRPEIGLPLDCQLPELFTQAAQVFIGYLMLDALVANQDRHHENWGLILSPPSRPGLRVTLAPTFDHASSLGRNETDHVRLRRLATSDRGDSVEKFCDRAASAFYPSMKANKPLSTLAAFTEAAKSDPAAAAYWLDRLRQTTIADYEGLFQKIPPDLITVPASQFALRMLEINRERLLS
jgi:hypothetical protein